MIFIKTEAEIDKMRQAGKLAYLILEMIGDYIKPGVTTEELNKRCEEFTKAQGALSAPLNYKGFPKSICTSINNVVCHGIPSTFDVLNEGDIINVDVTPIIDSYHGDSSRTFFVGNVDPGIVQLVERTKRAMEIGIETIRPGGYFGDIGKAIESYIKPFGYGIVTAFGGHGIGSKFHEDPIVLHHRQRKRGAKFKPGMTFTVEPMINMGKHAVYVDKLDGWTVYTKDGTLSAQFEHTVLVTETGVEILTLP